MVCPASSTNEFIMIHLWYNMMVTENLAVFVELLSDTYYESFFVASSVDDDMFIIYLVC